MFGRKKTSPPEPEKPREVLLEKTGESRWDGYAYRFHLTSLREVEGYKSTHRVYQREKSSFPGIPGLPSYYGNRYLDGESLVDVLATRVHALDKEVARLTALLDERAMG